MNYLDVARLLKQAATEVATPKANLISQPAKKPDPSLVGTVKYKDLKTGKMVVEHPVRGQQAPPVKRAPIKKPTAAPTTIKSNIPMTFSTGPAKSLPYKRIETKPFGNPLRRSR